MANKTGSFRKSFFFVAGIGLLAVLVTNTCLKNPSFNTIDDQLKFANQVNSRETAEQCYISILGHDSNNIEYNYLYVTNHFEIPKEKKTGKTSYRIRDDLTLYTYYERKIQSKDTLTTDIGNYCIGLYYSIQSIPDSAIFYFSKVHNKNQKFLNNSIGSCILVSDTNGSEFYFRKEITLKGNVTGAYHNLIPLLYKKGKSKELDSLINNKETKQYFPYGIASSIYLHNVKIIDYILLVFDKILSGLNIFGFLGAFLIMGSWIMYLRKIDVFKPKGWFYTILVCVLGMFFTLGVFPLSDLIHLVFNFKLNGNFLNDFSYCVIGIGAVEELMKILPFLILLKFTRAIEEPFDYILYTSISALGFAFVENLEYFNSSNLNIIHSRALISAIFHMFSSSLIGYGMMLNRYKNKKNPYLNFLLFFGLAALSHGFFDFWLINKTVSSFSLLSILFLIVCIYVWDSFKNNALNQSSFFDKNKAIDLGKVSDYLIYSLSSIFIFEYLAISIKFGPSIGNTGLYDSLSSGIYLSAFLTRNLSTFSLRKGQWAPIQYWGSSSQKVDYTLFIGNKVELHGFSKHPIASHYLPNTGSIDKTLTISGQSDWFLIKLEKIAVDVNYCKDYVLIRVKNEVDILNNEEPVYVAFYAIPDLKTIDNENINRTEFIFCNWATAKIIT